MAKSVRLTLAAVCATLALVPATAAAQGDTSAVAINTKDGSSIFRLALNVRRAMQDVVDTSNAAVAYASCVECQTVAVSIQLVLVMSDPDVVSPTNIALAINEECSSCNTLASAYQYVLTTGGPVHFDADGNRELASIRQDFRDLVKRSEDMDLADIQADADGLVERLYAVVDGHLVSAGRDPEADVSPENADPTATPAPDESSTPAPEESSTPAPEESASPPPSLEEDASPSPPSQEPPSQEENTSLVSPEPVESP
jgi:putative peptide zinc metalloprotease protein